jgi:hypothetical protein
MARNTPCPCGSGKKSKLCCASRSSLAVLPPGAALHRMDERLVEQMVAFANQRRGREWLAAPMTAYFQLQPFEREDLQLFMPWVMNHWRVNGRPMREWFLEERGDALAEAEHGWLLSQAAAVVSVWEVREVREGQGLQVKELLGGEERFVYEVTGSRMVKVRDGMLGRVVDHEGLSVFCGVYPRTLPPRQTDEVVRAARRMLKVRGKWVPRQKLASEGVALELIHLWAEQVLVLESQPPPTLMNTDGEPLLFTTDHFSFPARERKRVLEQLLKVEGAELSNEAEATEIVFLKPGNAMHPGWENTVLGRVVVSKDRARLEANSVERATTLRGRVEAACGALLTHRAREHADPEALLEPPGAGADAGAVEHEPADPEMIAALRAFKARHYAGWLDAPLPLLNGKTPREAVRTEAGRRRVDVLLKQLEHGEALLPEEERTDLAPLRGELGLTE